MAVDENENLVNEILPYVTDAQIGDSTNENFLESLGIKNYDICFVTIGGNFQNSLETTSLLKELGAKMVISRAERDVQAKFLLRNGADEVIYPEKQIANWAAILLEARQINYNLIVVIMLMHIGFHNLFSVLAVQLLLHISAKVRESEEIIE